MKVRYVFPVVGLGLGLAVLAAADDGTFNPLHHSGAASPYFDAPSQAGIPYASPSECKVDQAAYIVRHGSRYPEPGSYTGWVTLYQKFQNASTPYNATGPLAFIKSWVPPVDDVAHEPLYLTSTGALESYALGVGLRKRYGFTPGGGNLTVWSASQQRVLATAAHFLRGYLSQGSYTSSANLNRGSIVSLPDSVNWTFADSLTYSNGCPLYNNGSTGTAASNTFSATYQGAVAQRLNSQYLTGSMKLVASDIGVMMDLCGFQDEINGDTRFCDVFEPSEWLDYEYHHDLNYYYGSGPGNPYAGTSAWPLVKSLTDLLVAGPNKTIAPGTFTPPPLIMSFTHDNDLPPVIAALGLWNSTPGVYPLSLTAPNPKRDFRTSYLVSFRGYVALERLTCTGAPEPYVRVRANAAPVPVPGCTSGPGSTCPLSAFAAYVNGPRLAAVGDFVQRCGLVGGVANATAGAKVDFYTSADWAGSAATGSLIELSIGDVLG